MALERFVVIDGLPYEVAGVARPGFQGVFGDTVEAWVPANDVIPLIVKVPVGRVADSRAWTRMAAFYGVASSEQFSSTELAGRLAPAMLQLRNTAAALHVSPGLTTDPVRAADLRKWTRFGLLLAAIFTLVSSLNYALVLLAGTPRYAEEVRLKKALGAGNGRLMMELMIGPAAVVSAGMVGASVFCACGLLFISRCSAFYGQLVRGSWRAALLAVGIQAPLACFLTLVVGLIPAVVVLRAERAPRLGYTSTAPRSSGYLLQALVTLQITFGIGTWILSGMTVSAVRSLLRQPLGFDSSGLTVVSIRPVYGTVTFSVGGENDSSFPSAAAIAGLLEQVAAVPGVRSVSFASSAPFGQPMATLAVRAVDGEFATPRTVYSVDVSPGYFRTLGSQLVRGRDFLAHDAIGGAHEIIINETLARELWPRRDPVNRSLNLTDAGGGGIPAYTFPATVVGVVADMRLSGALASPEPTVFLSLEGLPVFDVTPELIVRGAASVHSLEEAVKGEVAARTPGLGAMEIYSAADRARQSLSREKQRAYVAWFAALAMAIVVYMGLYGALAHYVNTRRRELAVQMCLGASPQTIRGMIVARAAGCALAAVVLSLPLWPVLARLSTEEYVLGRVSWSTPRGALLSLACVAVAVLISLIPAANARRVSLAEALREQ